MMFLLRLHRDAWWRRYAQTLIAVVFFVQTSCGKLGYGDKDPDRPLVDSNDERQEEEPWRKFFTGIVPLNLERKSVSVPDCMSHTSALLPIQSSLSVQTDGDASEWAERAMVIPEDFNDTPNALDLGDIKFIVTQYDIHIAATVRGLQQQTDFSVTLEFGGLGVKDGQISSQVQRLFRYTRQGLWVHHVERGWLPISGSFGQAALNGSTLEVRLSRDLIGQVTGWPVWWLRVLSQALGDSLKPEKGLPPGDSSGAYFALSLIQQDSRPFQIDNCQIQLRGQSINIQAISDLGLEGASVQVVLRAVRAALATLLGRFGGESQTAIPLGVGGFAVVVTDKNFSHFHEAIGSAEMLSRHFFFAGGSDSTTDGGASFRSIFSSAFTHLQMLQLANAAPGAPGVLRLAVTQALLDKAQRELLGLAYWLERYPETVASFVAMKHKGDLVEDLGLGSVGDDTSPWIAKSRAFGHLLDDRMEHELLQETWRKLGKVAGAIPSQDYWRLFKQELHQVLGSDEERIRIDNLWLGWVDGHRYSEKEDPLDVHDADNDGLPTYFEHRWGLNSKRRDSDGDGWHDGGELLSGIDPLASAAHPEALVNDGVVGDWLELLSQRLNIDQGAAAEDCPMAADIAYFQAVISPVTLGIGVAAKRTLQSGEGPVYWDVYVQVPGATKQFVIKGNSAHRGFNVTDVATGAFMKSYALPWTTGNGELEWLMPLEEVGLTPDPKDPGATQVRVRSLITRNNAEILCDDTVWFVPLTNLQPAQEMAN